MVERAELGFEEESLVCVLTLSLGGRAWAIGSGWDTATDCRPGRSQEQMAPWERLVKAVRC